MAPRKTSSSSSASRKPAASGVRRTAAKAGARASAATPADDPANAAAATADDSVTRVTAEGNVELLDVRTLHEQLCDACDQGAPVEIDLASVTKIGTGGLQVLVAFVRDAKSQQVPYRWAGLSRTVVQAAKEAGLAAHLDLPEPSPNREVD